MDGEISPAELEQKLTISEPNPETDHETTDPLVVDIRNPGSFAREHIPGSVNIPLGELPTAVERVAEREHVVTVCPKGKSSIRAARLVGSFGGFSGRVESLEGGLEAWSGPTESENRSNPSGDAPDAPF